MKPRHTSMRQRGPALVAALALGALPGIVIAQDAAAEQRQRDQAVRDIELRMEREEARRDMAERERGQREALRGQEESIRRLEEAQRRLESSSREVAELSTDLGRNLNYGWTVSPPPPRALLGVGVMNRGREGAVVNQVSPGGAAAEAGIRTGDVIVSIDGKDLTKESDPSRALVEQMNRVEPDRKLRVEVLRGADRMAMDVTPRTPPVGATGATGSAFLQMLDQSRMPQPAFTTTFRSADLLRGMEFATISERLGSYFGVTEGVLVVRAGANPPFTLQDGDVILSIDGRVPTSAQHAGRILRSYQPGEKLRLRVQRDRKAIDIDATAPGERN